MMNTVTILMILITQACLGITGEDMGAVIDVVSACLNNHSLPCLFTPQETLAIGPLAVPTEENIHIKILCIIINFVILNFNHIYNSYLPAAKQLQYVICLYTIYHIAIFVNGVTSVT